MGLDWNPGNKPKSGFETEFRDLVVALAGDKLGSQDRPRFVDTLRTGLLKSLKRRRSDAVLFARYNEISISAFETLNAPRVGFDARADAWARQMHRQRNIATPLDEGLLQMRGFYVVELAEPCDGIPLYSNGRAGYVERFSFRADFLKTCISVIGNELLEEAYTIKFAPELLAYANRLQTAASDFASSSGVAIPTVAPVDPDTVESQLHIVDAAARWCRFWAERAHLLEPYF